MSFRQHDVRALAFFEPVHAHGPAAAWFVPREAVVVARLPAGPDPLVSYGPFTRRGPGAARQQQQVRAPLLWGGLSQPPPVSARARACCSVEALCGR